MKEMDLTVPVGHFLTIFLFMCGCFYFSIAFLLVTVVLDYCQKIRLE